MRSLEEIAKINETTEREHKQRIALHSITTHLANALERFRWMGHLDKCQFWFDGNCNCGHHAAIDALENWRKAKEGTL